MMSSFGSWDILLLEGNFFFGKANEVRFELGSLAYSYLLLDCRFYLRSGM
jgi:hypothetical protein